MIKEVIVTTSNADGTTHIAPMGIREEADLIIIAPFRPSATLDNIQRNKTAVINYIDDVRIFAGCLTGRNKWPLLPTEKIKEHRLATALSHAELQLQRSYDDELRPRFYCQAIHEKIHKPFRGFNRAQAAVLETAILVSRLPMLADEKIDQEIAYLTIAVDKTAGENEKIAWGWLMDKIREYRLETRKDKMA